MGPPTAPLILSCFSLVEINVENHIKPTQAKSTVKANMFRPAELVSADSNRIKCLFTSTL